MAYRDKFTEIDDLILHLSPFVNAITDSALKAKYAGFLSVSVVTVYELAIKEIITDFARKKHSVFGAFIEKHFSHINGRIKLQDLKDSCVKPFGDKYLNKFEKKLSSREQIILTTQRRNIRSDYTNLIICRHKYVHVGNPTLTFQEVLDSYTSGKEVIHSFYEAMRR